MTDQLQAHIAEYRTKGGKLGGDFADSPTLLLHSIGARSGVERICPLGHQTVDGGFAVFGTNWGKPHHPAWYHNLLAHPQAEIEVGLEVLPVRARVAIGDERDRIWARQSRLVPAMAAYERRARRKVPVVILELS